MFSDERGSLFLNSWRPYPPPDHQYIHGPIDSLCKSVVLLGDIITHLPSRGEHKSRASDTKFSRASDEARAERCALRGDRRCSGEHLHVIKVIPSMRLSYEDMN